MEGILGISGILGFPELNWLFKSAMALIFWNLSIASHTFFTPPVSLQIDVLVLNGWY
jgi:hypothetical protein